MEYIGIDLLNAKHSLCKTVLSSVFQKKNVISAPMHSWIIYSALFTKTLAPFLKKIVIVIVQQSGQFLWGIEYQGNCMAKYYNTV